MGGGASDGGTIIAGGRLLISCRFLPVWLAWPWPITSELLATVLLPLLPREWTSDWCCRAYTELREERDRQTRNFWWERLRNPLRKERGRHQKRKALEIAQQTWGHMPSLTGDCRMWHGLQRKWKDLGPEVSWFFTCSQIDTKTDQNIPNASHKYRTVLPTKFSTLVAAIAKGLLSQ